MPPDRPPPDPDTPLLWNDATFRPNQVLANSFVVKTLISRGGMGEIYRAAHRDLGTEHAIKILRPSMLAEPSAVALLLEEARILLHVRNDAIVPCHGLIRDSDDRLLLVMEYLRGATLSVRMRQGTIPIAGLQVLLRRLLGALEALRGYGIVHQDLSPDNIILRNDSLHEATLIDFGVARVMSDRGGAHGALDFAGKYSWASPEQLDPSRADLISPSCDVYSLGLVIAAACLGQKIDMGHDLPSALQARRRVPDLDGLPKEIARTLEPMLAPEARRRPTAARVLADLESLGAGRKLFRRLFGKSAPARDSD